MAYPLLVRGAVGAAAVAVLARRVGVRRPGDDRVTAACAGVALVVQPLLEHDAGYLPVIVPWPTI